MTAALLTPAEVAARLKVSTGTLKNWRYHRTGPAWFKLESGSVRYAQADLDAYIARAKRESRVAS